MKIFCGNFAFTVGEEYLRGLFEPFGQVDSVSVVTDRETGRARGFAFIEMPDAAAAQAAITALNGSDSGGRPLNVSEARPKAERGTTRGSGRDNYRDRGPRGNRREPRW